MFFKRILHKQKRGYVRCIFSVEKVADKILLKIQDNGVGISPENLHKILHTQERVKSYGTNKEKGTGLGLRLCKEYVQKLAGEFDIKSIEGQGSTFLIYWKAKILEKSQQ